MYKCDIMLKRDMLAKEGKVENEDAHWLARARYHFRMEEYWRDRAMRAEKELEAMRNSRRVKKSKISSEVNISRCCD